MPEKNAPTVEESSGVGLMSLFAGVSLLLKNRKLIAMFALGGAVVGLLLMLRSQTYMAEATVMPPQSSSLSSMASQLGNLSALSGMSSASSLTIRSQQDLYVALLQSRTLQDAFIRRFDLQKQYKTRTMVATRKALAKHLEVDGTSKDGLIRLYVKDRDADRAANLANGYLDEYRKFSSQMAIGEAAHRRKFFEEQLNEEKDKLAAAEEELRKTQQQSGAIEIDAQTKALIQSAVSLRAQIASKEVELQSIRAYAGRGNLDLIQAEQELSGLRSQLAKLSTSDADSAASMILPRGALPQTALKYVRDTREVKYHEALFEILARQYESARLDEARQGTQLQIVDGAVAPDRPVSLPRPLILLLSIIGGVICGAAYAVAKTVALRLSNDPMLREKLAEIRAAR